MNRPCGWVDLYVLERTGGRDVDEGRVWRGREGWEAETARDTKRRWKRDFKKESRTDTEDF